MNDMTLLGLAKAGAGIVVDGSRINPMTLQGLCHAAAGSGGKVTIRNALMLNDLTLMGLANIGKASVEFDFTE